MIKNKMRVEGVVRIYETPGIRVLSRAELAQYGRKVVETRNLITDYGLDVIVGMLLGGMGTPFIGGGGYGASNFEELRIAQMVITDAGAPATPVPGDTALVGLTLFDWRSDYPTNGQSLLTGLRTALGEVTFSGLIPPQTLNGTTIKEEGLFTASGLLVARTTFSFTKNANVGLQFDHSIVVSRS